MATATASMVLVVLSSLEPPGVKPKRGVLTSSAGMTALALAGLAIPCFKLEGEHQQSAPASQLLPKNAPLPRIAGVAPWLVLGEPFPFRLGEEPTEVGTNTLTSEAPSQGFEVFQALVGCDHCGLWVELRACWNFGLCGWPYNKHDRNAA